MNIKIASGLTGTALQEAQDFAEHYSKSYKIYQPASSEFHCDLYKKGHYSFWVPRGQSGTRIYKYFGHDKCPTIGKLVDNPEDFGLNPGYSWRLIAYAKGSAGDSKSRTNYHHLMFSCTP